MRRVREEVCKRRVKEEVCKRRVKDEVRKRRMREGFQTRSHSIFHVAVLRRLKNSALVPT
ncbi:hypothetical protein D3Z58_12040 [Clostridiaceae bacterium]|nr:hypothetical protein [Clostridiaceae bacterium]